MPRPAARAVGGAPVATEVDPWRPDPPDLQPIEGRVKAMWPRLLILVVGMGTAAAAWFAVREIGAWQFRTELRQAQRELGARRVGKAKARLVRLAERWPGRGEVEYWLGACEMAAGHTEAALAAWGRVPER